MTKDDDTREDGWYWVKFKKDSGWLPVRFNVIEIEGKRMCGVWNNIGYSLDKKLKGFFLQVYPYRLKVPDEHLIADTKSQQQTL